MRHSSGKLWRATARWCSRSFTTAGSMGGASAAGAGAWWPRSCWAMARTLRVRVMLVTRPRRAREKETTRDRLWEAHSIACGRGGADKWESVATLACHNAAASAPPAPCACAQRPQAG